MTAALVLDDAPVLSALDARRLTAEIRQHLGSAIAKLAAARAGRADLALGYPTWHDYVLAEFGDLRDLALPRIERQALVASMADAGLPVRAISDRLGVSVGTVQNDRGALGKVIPLRRPTEPPVDPYAGLTRTAEAFARVAAAGHAGLTSIELDAATGWPMGSATGLLSRLERRGLIRREPVFRERRAAYVVTSSGAAALASVG